MRTMLHHGFDFPVQQLSGNQTAVAISAFHLHPGTGYFIATIWTEGRVSLFARLDIGVLAVSTEEALIKSVEGRK